MKRFLKIGLALYLAAAALGIVLFRSPDYSRAYRSRFGEEHKRYLRLKKDPVFERYAQRPRRDPANPELEAERVFLESHENQPEFQAERRRIERYTLYFKWLNTLTFAAILVRLAAKPLLAFLDKRIQALRADLDAAARTREEADCRLAETQARLDAWPDLERRLRHEADDRINDDLARIREELRQARIELAREVQDRRRAEVFEAERRIKDELVSRAVCALEAKYADEATPERLAEQVDRFIWLMEQIS